MLRKLIKHELRATARVMGPMLGLTLLLAVGGRFAVNNMLDIQNKLMVTLGSFLVTAFAAAIAGSFIVSFVLMIRRFCKNLLQDEGYLMMTLPATVHEHVFSKLMVSILWSAATAITAGLAMCILVLDLEFVTLYGPAELLAELHMGDLRLSDYMGHALLMAAEGVLLAIVADACLCLQIYAAMAVGHSFTHHKGLLSFAAYLGFSILWNAFQNGSVYLMNLLAQDGIQFGFQNFTRFAAVHVTLWSLILFLAVPSALWYAITTYFLKNRLNLQ